MSNIVGENWEQKIVADLDSELNKWIDNVPYHRKCIDACKDQWKLNYKTVRWDPAIANADFFNQSAMVYCHFYLVQILVHRPFIPKHGKKSSQSFPSQAICTNAARSCCHLLDAQQKRVSQSHSYQIVRSYYSGVLIIDLT